MPEKAETVLQASHLSEIKPLQLRFLKGEVHLSSHNLEMIKLWTRQVIKYNIPVFIHSSASAPTGIRDITTEAAHHEAIRIAFNRGLITKSFLKQSGIDENRLVLKAIGPDQSEIHDSIIITTQKY